MACRALDAARSPGKLTAVNVLMAIRTLLESERFFEIAALVTSEAIDALVFSDEGIPGFGVIEFSRLRSAAKPASSPKCCDRIGRSAQKFPYADRRGNRCTY